MTGPLAGLRVLELASGVAGPYGARLLAMLGADVLKVEPPGGDPARRQPLDATATATEEPSPLFVHLNAGKRLASSEGVDLAAALAWADVVIEGSVRGTSRAAGARGLLVTTSAWGFEADAPGEIGDELLVQAASGAMSTTGDREGPPLRLPGFQAQYFAGGHVAAAALAGLRRSGCRHIDVPWVACIATGVEGGWSRNLQTDRRDPPGGPFPIALFPGGALPCADGFVAPGTVRPADWVAQCGVYERPDLLTDERFRSRRRRTKNWEELWKELSPWYAARTRAQIFGAALEGSWACGMVLAGTDALSDPHLEARAFLCDVALPGGSPTRGPHRPWIAPDLPVPAPRLARAGEHDGAIATVVPRDPVERTPLDGVRVIELTQAWAGPFAGRLLGALGADVIKVESPRRPDGWRGPAAFREMAPHLDVDPEAMSVDISANFNALNRNKRHCAIDLTTEGGRDVLLELAGAADVVIANMTARVLPSLRLAYGDLRRANERIVLVHMPALGASGPYRNAVGYGTIVEGMGGLGALFGPPEAGARISQTYYPDPVAGVHAAVAVLSMLERRDRTGAGGEVDLSHQEALFCQLGETIVAAAGGRPVGRSGNRMPGARTSGVFACADGRWVAVVSTLDCDAIVARSEELDCDALVDALRAAGARAGEVLHHADARERGPMPAYLERVVHEVTGDLPYLRTPLAIDGAALDSRLPAPVFDRHTREVLSEWISIDRARLRELEASGAVGGAPDPEQLRQFYLDRSRR